MEKKIKKSKKIKFHFLILGCKKAILIVYKYGYIWCGRNYSTWLKCYYFCNKLQFITGTNI